MTVTYGTLKDKIGRALNDANQTKYGEDLVWDAVCAAHDAVLPWVPCLNVITLTAGSGGMALDTFPIPSDSYQVDAVQIVSSGLFLPRSILSANKVRNNGQSPAPYDWIEFPTGYVYLSEELPEGETIKVYYRTLWTKPASATDLTFVLTVPTYAHMGMVYYACSHCLLPSSIGAGNLSQFKTKVDSGTPVDNPVYDMCVNFLKRFDQEMRMMPPFSRVGN